jgi:hypothetical protein
LGLLRHQAAEAGTAEGTAKNDAPFPPSHPPGLCATAKNGASPPPNAVIFECKAEFESGRRGSRKDPKNLKTQKTAQHER